MLPDSYPRAQSLDSGSVSAAVPSTAPVASEANRLLSSESEAPSLPIQFCLDGSGTRGWYAVATRPIGVLELVCRSPSCYSPGRQWVARRRLFENGVGLTNGKSHGERAITVGALGYSKALNELWLCQLSLPARSSEGALGGGGCLQCHWSLSICVHFTVLRCDVGETGGVCVGNPCSESAFATAQDIPWCIPPGVVLPAGTALHCHRCLASTAATPSAERPCEPPSRNHDVEPNDEPCMCGVRYCSRECKVRNRASVGRVGGGRGEGGCVATGFTLFFSQNADAHDHLLECRLRASILREHSSHAGTAPLAGTDHREGTRSEHSESCIGPRCRRSPSPSSFLPSDEQIVLRAPYLPDRTAFPSLARVLLLCLLHPPLPPPLHDLLATCVQDDCPPRSPSLARLGHALCCGRGRRYLKARFTLARDRARTDFLIGAASAAITRGIVCCPSIRGPGSPCCPGSAGRPAWCPHPG